MTHEIEHNLSYSNTTIFPNIVEPDCFYSCSSALAISEKSISFENISYDPMNLIYSVITKDSQDGKTHAYKRDTVRRVSYCNNR